MLDTPSSNPEPEVEMIYHSPSISRNHFLRAKTSPPDFLPDIFTHDSARFIRH